MSEITTPLPPQGLRPTHAQMLRHLRRSNEVALRAVALGHHPFGAVLVGPDQETVLLEQCNIDTVNHAESTLARVAATNYPAEFLWRCTLYTAVEPCCMCAGACYWAAIGAVVYGLSESRLGTLIGDNPENLTLDLSCRQVFAAGRRPVAVRGPFPELEAEILSDHAGFW